MRFLVPVFLCCTTLAAQVAPQRAVAPRAPSNRSTADNPNAVAPPPAQPEDKCVLEGTVINAVTGEPVKKAHLTLLPLGAPNGLPYGTISDEAGHFLIDDVDPGRYNFAANRSGFVTQSYSPDGRANRSSVLTLGNGQKMKEIVFKLTPQGVIAGRILDEDGEPLADAMVQTMVYAYQRGRRQLVGRGGGMSNDLGEFRLYGLRPGKYIVSATYQARDMLSGFAERTVGASQAQQAAEEGYATTYYPNSTNPENAIAIDIAPGGQVTGLNITLARIRTVRIKGHVSGGPDGDGRRTMVMLTPRETGSIAMPRPSVVDPQGNFQLRGVAPGSYTLRATYRDENKFFSASYPVDVATSNIEGLEMELRPPGDLEGHVVIEGSNSDSIGSRMRVLLQPKVMNSMIGGSNGVVQDDRTFKLTNIGASEYDANVVGLPEGYYLKTLRLGQQDVTNTGLDFSQGVPAGQLTVVINPNAGQVEGAVQNSKGDPAVGATVTLIPDAAHRSLTWLYKNANTDQNGHFTIKGVRPGEYKIYAWEELEPGAQQDPDFMKPHESAGEAVSVKEGSHETVQLKAIAADKSGEQQAAR